MVRKQTLAQEILKPSITVGEDNHLLHTLFLILLFKHLTAGHHLQQDAGLAGPSIDSNICSSGLKLHCIYHGVRKHL